jgi:hypothetical protein
MGSAVVVPALICVGPTVNISVYPKLSAGDFGLGKPGEGVTAAQAPARPPG